MYLSELLIHFGNGKEIKVNLTSKDYYDISVKLMSIKNNTANITIKKINESINNSQNILRTNDNLEQPSKNNISVSSENIPKTTKIGLII